MNETTSDFTPGQKVRVSNLDSDYSPIYGRPLWIPSGKLTGTVLRSFKNGLVAVDVDQVRTQGGKPRTLHLPHDRLEISNGS